MRRVALPCLYRWRKGVALSGMGHIAKKTAARSFIPDPPRVARTGRRNWRSRERAKLPRHRLVLQTLNRTHAGMKTLMTLGVGCGSAGHSRAVNQEIDRNALQLDGARRAPSRRDCPRKTRAGARRRSATFKAFREQCRDVVAQFGAVSFPGVRFAFRVLRKSPGFTPCPVLRWLRLRCEHSNLQRHSMEYCFVLCRIAEPGTGSSPFAKPA